MTASNAQPPASWFNISGFSYYLSHRAVMRQTWIVPEFDDRTQCLTILASTLTARHEFSEAESLIRLS